MQKEKDGVRAVGMAFLYFIVWVTLVSMLSLVKDLDPIKGRPGLLRLWYEFLPLLITLVLDFIFRGLSRIKSSRPDIRKLSRDSIFGLVFGLVWIGLVLVILRLAGVIRIGSKNLVESLAIFSLALFLNTIMQEYLVRGYMFERVSMTGNNFLAIVFTSLIFTLLHGGAFEVGLVGVLNVVSMSILMSLLLIYRKGLVAPIMVHFIWNFIGGIILGGVSLAEDYPSIYNLSFTGSKILAGGSFKLEGSIVVFLVNISMIALVYFKNKDRTRIFS